jgi:DNA recombination protein RmuC
VTPQLLTMIVLGGLLALIVASVSAYLAVRGGRQTAALTAMLREMGGRLDRTGSALNARLDGATGEMNRTLSQGLQQATQALTGSIGRVREETRAKIDEKFVEVTERLGDLKATNDRIMEFSRSLDAFQRVLQSPKLRGDFGEFTLEQMLADLVPAEAFECQARIAGFRVDALIRTPHGVLCIDSKFPLDNFSRALEEPDGAAREAFLRAFAGDVKGRIDEIAVRYIVPPQTLEIAFMFVPSENVYYELLTRPELLEYARARRVVAVSPNTMYAYLQAMAIGFRGLKIQQEARRVEQLLGELRGRFERFRDHFGKIGRHLENAQSHFTGAQRDVERFQSALDGLRVGRIDGVREQEESTSSAPESLIAFPAPPKGPGAVA